MASQDNPELKRLVAEAMRLGPAERERFLETLPEATRIEVTRRIDEAMTAQTRVGDLDDLVLAQHFPSEPEIWTPATGKRVGAYVLIEKIGTGGYGDVWKVQERELPRRVLAMKILHPGLHSDRVLRRFRTEMAALQKLDHQGIAKFLGSGLTPANVPYFVMQYVNGLQLDGYCQRDHPPIRELVRLFVELCEAVHHAHQNGLVHRDLKPSNVLVANPRGTPPYPVVVDFGVVKAIEEPLTMETEYSTRDQPLGTWQYMSPEQVDGHPDVSVPSDIYSLGVILYQLLVGTCPLERHRLQAASDENRRRLVREEPCEPIHLRFRRNGAEGQSILARHRGLDRHQLYRILKGIPGRVAMRAVKKEPSHRYQSALEMAEELRGFLIRRPPAAPKPSVIKFLFGFVVASAVAVSGGYLVWDRFRPMYQPQDLPPDSPPRDDPKKQTPKPEERETPQASKDDSTSLSERPWHAAHVDDLGRRFFHEFAAGRFGSKVAPSKAVAISRANDALALISDPDSQRKMSALLVWRRGDDGPLVRTVTLSGETDPSRGGSPAFTLLGFDAAENHLYAASPSAGLFEWDVARSSTVSEARAVLPLGDGIPIALDASHPTRIAVCFDDGRVRSIDPQRPDRVWDVPGGDGQVALAEVSPDGRWLLTVSGEGQNRVRIRDLNQLDSTHELSPPGETGPTFAAAFSSDGTKVAISHGSSLSLWDCASGEREWSPAAEEDSTSPMIFSLAIAPDRRHIVSGHFGGRMRLWRLDARATSGSSSPPDPSGHDNTVNVITWSDRGEVVASASWNGDIRFWRRAPNGELAPSASPIRLGQRERASSIRFNRDDSEVIVVTDRVVQVWPVPADVREP